MSKYFYEIRNNLFGIYIVKFNNKQGLLCSKEKLFKQKPITIVLSLHLKIEMLQNVKLAKNTS